MVALTLWFAWVHIVCIWMWIVLLIVWNCFQICIPLNSFALKFYIFCLGVAGGGQYNEDGNGANTLCLPHDPEHPPFSISVAEGDDYAHLYGSEYRLNLHRVHSPEDVPCAVCRTHMASSTIMVPGKHTCPVKWQKQYSGLLTASRHVYQKSEYLCLHEDPDFLEGSRNKDDGRLFYPVKSVCGSLPCPPYEDDMLVSCVVCSG